jgi:ATP-dependent DNA helicase DinG
MTKQPTVNLAELSRSVPNNLPRSCTNYGTPLFTAFECVLLERDSGKSYSYKIVNLKSGKSEILSRRPTPLTTSAVPSMLERIRQSPIAGASIVSADGSGNANKTQTIIETVFNELMPEHGYVVRQPQIGLANEIFATIKRHGITLAEAETGTGKTHGYLVPAIIAKRAGLNDAYNQNLYPEMSIPDTKQMPIVISTSSIALQKALVTKYIPELSKILVQHGVLKKPITAVLRKGKEHYICDRNLDAYKYFEHDEEKHIVLDQIPDNALDLSELDGLTPYVKRKICVPTRCDRNCSNFGECRYHKFMEYAQNPEIDIQVCNHNYVLADIVSRSKGRRPLLPNYQTLIIDEAHKFLPAAQSIYGSELGDISDITTAALDVCPDNVHKLNRAVRKLFGELTNAAETDDDEAERREARFTVDATRHLKAVGNIADSIARSLRDAGHEYIGLMREFERLRSNAVALNKSALQIRWLERGDNGNVKLCGIPKRLNELLKTQLWNKGLPIVLTSGTLSANGDFTRTMQTLGLERLGGKLKTVRKPSPFNHKENSLLYISENVPFPLIDDEGLYISKLTDEIERLILASHGHAAVLFTSYKAMDMVHERLSARNLPFPLFTLERGSSAAIDRFKQSGNGVLLASGALWEGIDIPGDALSMLIIVKLPFAVPDPIGEYEQSKYSTFGEYRDCVLIPEMLIKLKQGYGRLIRTECDSGVVALLDCRAGLRGSFRNCVVGALPDCRVTENITVVEGFMQEKKPLEYFN